MSRPGPRLWSWVLTAVLWGALARPSHAGQACEDTPQTVAQVTRAMALAQRVARQLDATGAELLLLARAGQDLSRYGLAWSHLGFVLREPGAEGQPSVWRVLHKLNACGTADGQLWREGLGNFFLDRPHRYEAAFVVLRPDLQAALAGALEPAATDRERAQAWLRLRGYMPSVLRVDALTRLGARVGMAHVAFDDHPNSERFADRIATVTVDSVFQWLLQAGLAGPAQRVR